MQAAIDKFAARLADVDACARFLLGLARSGAPPQLAWWLLWDCVGTEKAAAVTELHAVATGGAWSPEEFESWLARAKLTHLWDQHAALWAELHDALEEARPRLTGPAAEK